MNREDEHIRRVASAIEDFIPPGRTYLVTRDDSGVTVLPMDADTDADAAELDLSAAAAIAQRPLPDRAPALVGRLLTVNEAISSSGVGPMVGIWLLAILACWGVAEGWLTTAVGLPVEPLQSWWVYIGLMLGGLVAGASASGWTERAAFERHRESLLRAIADDGAEPFALLAELEGDERFEDVSRLLKKSADAGVRQW